MARKAKKEDDRPLAKTPVIPSYTPANQPDSPKTGLLIGRLRKAILACLELSEKERVAVYNSATGALRELVRDLADDPALGPKLVPAESVQANDYNPNKVAAPELDLLEHSIRCDGVTMPVVVIQDVKAGIWPVVDGFHRQLICRERLKRKYIPVAVIDRKPEERIASTIRHNRARGKHQVDLMAQIVKRLMSLGQTDAQIAEAIGMTEEELLRLKQVAGVAKILAAEEYSQSWGLVEGADGDASDSTD